MQLNTSPAQIFESDLNSIDFKLCFKNIFFRYDQNFCVIVA